MKLILYEPRCERAGFLHAKTKTQIIEADRCICFRYIDSTIPLLPEPEISRL